jgi:ferritin
MWKEKKETKNTSMLNQEIINLMNEQIWLENHASFYYLDLSIKFNIEGFGGMSKFFAQQSQEERVHMLKLVDYLLEKDGVPTLPNYNFMEENEESFNILSHFENSLLNERKVTNAINKIVSKCKEVGDYTTENFIQWFVTEQREEENKFKEIIDNLKIIGNDGSGLYEINKELGNSDGEEINQL